MSDLTSKIIGVGGYLPDKIITNFDLEKIVDTTDEWIKTRTGITKRQIAENQTTSDLAIEAIKDAINNANIDKNDIDLIICATTTPDLTFPSTACIIQNKLGIEKNIIAFDIQAVCCGFVYALSVANDIIKSGKIKTAIVVGAEKMSSLIDWKDRTTCVLFGDGAGAIVLQSTNEENTGIIDTELYANGNYIDMLKTSGGTSTNQVAGNILMDGKAVFKHAVEKMSSSIQNIVKNNNLTLEDIDFIIPHQANYRILSMVAEKLNIQNEKFIITIDKHANTSSASIPLALNEAIKQNKIKKGDLLIFEALGAGFTWGSVLVRW